MNRSNSGLFFKTILLLCFTISIDSANAEVQILRPEIPAFSLKSDLVNLDFSDANKDPSTQRLIDYIRTRSRAFGIEHADNLDLELDTLIQDESGASVRLNQLLRHRGTQQDIPIRGANIVALISPDGRLLSLNSGLIPPPSFSFNNITPLNLHSLPEVDRRALAETLQTYSTPEFVQSVERTRSPEHLFSQMRQTGQVELVAQKTEDGGADLVWRMSRPFSMPLQIDISATPDESGQIFLKRIQRADHMLIVEVYDAGPLFPLRMGTLRFKAPVAPILTSRPDRVAKDAFSATQTLQKIYSYYLSVHNWNSWDNRGSVIRASIDIEKKFLRENAAWAGAPFNRFFFGKGTRTLTGFESALDVVSHEYGHAVNDSSARLQMMGQSGALSEHFGDVMGISAESHLTGQPVVYRVGASVLTDHARAEASRRRGVPVTALRDMLHPPSSLSDQPSHMREVDTKYPRHCVSSDRNDSCGIHYSMGVPNLAIARSMVALGREKIQSLVFATMTRRLRQDADFAEYLRQLLLECRDRTANANNPLAINSADCQRIEEEFDKVGVRPSGGALLSADIGIGTGSPASLDILIKTCRMFEDLRNQGVEIEFPEFCTQPQ